MSRRIWLVVSVAVGMSACADAPVAPPVDAISEIAPGPKPVAGVAALGILIERSGSTLVLEQRGFELQPTANVTVLAERYEPSIGRVGDQLRVLVDASTQIFLNGQRVSSLDAVPARAFLVVAGTPQGEALMATLVMDLAGLGRSTEMNALAHGSTQGQTDPGSTESPVTAAVTSLCLGQDMDYDHFQIEEFHGCWGGPSVSDNFDIPEIPIGCGILGCWILDELSYTVAAGGWIFDFPFRFGATSPGLTYHVPGTVSLSLEALPASGTAFTFTGGLGVSVGLKVLLCNPFGCFDTGTHHVSFLSMIHQATEAGPLRPEQRLQINEVACPSIGVIAIPDFPFDPLSIALCEDLALDGRSFFAQVNAVGARGLAQTFRGFSGANQTMSVTPDATEVKMLFSQFSWTPELAMGVYFKIQSFDVLTLWTSPTVPLFNGPFQAVSTPFPTPGVGFTVATDPLSPIDDLRYLFQPTVATGGVIPVAPAPTTLAIISSPTLEEGSPLRARLTESFDGSPIVGAQMRFTATGTSGTLVTLGVTDGNGVAQTILPNGEHSVLVEFDGSPVYLPSSATQRVFVYRPTTFVIWGGNAEGIALGGRYQFWGSQWHKQVTGGDFNANASFKGYAHTASGSSWIAGGGNSTRPPDDVAGLIGVIVATRITRQGESTLGNIAQRVILRVVDPDSYRPNPGHEAFGTLAALITPPPIT